MSYCAGILYFTKDKNTNRWMVGVHNGLYIKTVNNNYIVRHVGSSSLKIDEKIFYYRIKSDKNVNRWFWLELKKTELGPKLYNDLVELISKKYKEIIGKPINPNKHEGLNYYHQCFAYLKQGSNNPHNGLFLCYYNYKDNKYYYDVKDLYNPKSYKLLPKFQNGVLFYLHWNFADPGIPGRRIISREVISAENVIKIRQLI